MPASQSVHEATFDATENLPAPHSVHELAPAVAPVFVIDPAAHTVQLLASFDPVASTYFPASQLKHESALDAVEYFPAAHNLHVVAPEPGPSLVIEPAGQSLHWVLPSEEV